MNVSRDFQVLLKVPNGTRLKDVRAHDACDALVFAESLVPGSTTKGVVERNSRVSA
jgi:hypothetical protein